MLNTYGLAENISGNMPHTPVVDNIQDTFIDISTVHGFGLFSNRCFEPEEILGTLDGQLLPLKTYELIQKKIDLDDKLITYFFMECNYLPHDMLLVRPLRTKYSYINHSRNPNLYLKLDGSIITIRSLTTIEKGQELFLDYRKESLNNEYINGRGAAYL